MSGPALVPTPSLAPSYGGVLASNGLRSDPLERDVLLPCIRCSAAELPPVWRRVSRPRWLRGLLPVAKPLRPCEFGGFTCKHASQLHQPHGTGRSRALEARPARLAVRCCPRSTRMRCCCGWRVRLCALRRRVHVRLLHRCVVLQHDARWRAQERQPRH